MHCLYTFDNILISLLLTPTPAPAPAPAPAPVHLESSIGGDESHEALDDEAQEEGEAGGQFMVTWCQDQIVSRSLPFIVLIVSLPHIARQAILHMLLFRSYSLSLSPSPPTRQCRSSSGP